MLGSPPLIFNHDGSQFALMNSVAGTSGGAGDDGDEETPEGGLGAQPSIFYVALGAFADLEGAGALSYLNGTIGAGILPFALGGGPLAPFDFHLSAWDATTGVQKPAFPRVLEDWQFFSGPAIADLDGGADGIPEIVVSSGGYFVHAFNGVTGVEPAGWPKLTGHWVVASPLVGDIDGDGSLEVVVATRSGDLHVWDMPGGACETGAVPRPSVEWRKALHDEWGTGVYGRDTLRPAAISGSRAARRRRPDLLGCRRRRPLRQLDDLRGALAARDGEPELGRGDARDTVRRQRRRRAAGGLAGRVRRAHHADGARVRRGRERLARGGELPRAVAHGGSRGGGRAARMARAPS